MRNKDIAASTIITATWAAGLIGNEDRYAPFIAPLVTVALIITAFIGLAVFKLVCTRKESKE